MVRRPISLVAIASVAVAVGNVSATDGQCGEPQKRFVHEAGKGLPVRPYKPVVPVDVGTKIRPAKDAEGDMLRLQEEFASAMLWGDPRPADRLAHFNWLFENEYLRMVRGRQIGWFGVIQDVRPISNGRWLIKVEMTPIIYSGHASPIYDDVTEVYEFSGKKLRLVYSDARIPKPGTQVYPVN